MIFVSIENAYATSYLCSAVTVYEMRLLNTYWLKNANFS